MKKLFTSLMLMLSFTTFAQSQSTVARAALPSTELTLATALQLEKTGHLVIAKAQLAGLFDTDAEHSGVRLAYARVLTKTGLTDQAITVLSPLTSPSSQDWRPWFWTGTAMLLNKDFENSALFLDEALARQGQEVAIWVQRAIVEQEIDNPQAAIYMLQVADQIQPKNPDVMINFAYANEATGDIDKSIIAYKQFLKLSTADIKYGKLRSLVIVRLSQIAMAKNKMMSEPLMRISQQGPVK